MSQDEARLRCPTGLSPGLAPRALFQAAVPFAASAIAHAAVVVTLPGRDPAPVGSTEPPDEWGRGAGAREHASRWRRPRPKRARRSRPRRPRRRARPRCIPRRATHLPRTSTCPLRMRSRAYTAPRSRWLARREPPGGRQPETSPSAPSDSRDGHDAIRAQIAGWNPAPDHLARTSPGPGHRPPGRDCRSGASRRPPSSRGVLEASAGPTSVSATARGLSPQSATISGEVRVAFVIEPDGHVSGARDAGGTFSDGAVRRCIVRAVAQLSFPKPPDGTAQQVTIPVMLRSEEAVARLIAGAKSITLRARIRERAPYSRPGLGEARRGSRRGRDRGGLPHERGGGGGVPRGAGVRRRGGEAEGRGLPRGPRGKERPGARGAPRRAGGGAWFARRRVRSVARSARRRGGWPRSRRRPSG